MEPGRRSLGARHPLVLLAPATFFEGYDTFLLALALPLIREEFGMSLARAGVVVSVAFSGSLGALVLIALADRWGRRRVLAASIAGYTVATFATAFSRGIVDLAILQFLARMFLGVEYALAAILLVELVPEERRGRQLGILTSMSAFGHGAAGLGFLAILATDASWRVLYLVGIVPLVLVALARRSLPESLPLAHRSLAELRTVRRRWLGGATALVFLVTLASTAVTTFASVLVIEEWRISLPDLHPGYFLLWALAVGGFFLSGRLLDRVGRRPTAVAFLLGASAAAALAMTADTTPGRVVGLAAVIFFLAGVNPCVAAFTTEPFPAGVRGRVNALLRGVGFAAAALAPAFVGLLSEGLGTAGRALAILGISYSVAAVAVVAGLPETRRAERSA